MAVRKMKKYKDASEMKGTYKDDYIDYEAGDWYEIEQEEYINDPDNDYNDNLVRLQAGLYRQLFEEGETVLERKVTVYDYHNVHSWILDNLTTDIVFYNLALLMAGEKLSITYEDIVIAFEKEKEKVDSIFQEFAGKLETTADLSIQKFPEKADKKDREVLNKLAGIFLIERELSPENKYKLSKPVFCKAVVRGLLKHGYNQNSGFIFMRNFIEYHVEPASIQNYFRVCKKDIPMYRLKSV